MIEYLTLLPVFGTMIYFILEDIYAELKRG